MLTISSLDGQFSLDNLKVIQKAITICLIQYFEADFP